MKRLPAVFFFLAAVIGLVLFPGCQKELHWDNGPTGLLPVISTTVVTNINNIAASSGGTISSDGGSAITARGVCWSTTPNPVATGSHTSDGTGIGTFTSSVTGLAAATTYYIRAYASNSNGTAYGNEISFTTSTTSGNLPTIITAIASAISSTSATSGGHVTADGGAPVTVRGICWSTSPNPVVTGNHTVDGTGLGAYSSHMTGLSAVTQYYVRAYASNANGTAYGNEISFTTSPLITPDIYAAGYESNGTHTIAKYWKNGAAVNLSSGSADAEASSIFVSGADVYVCGWEQQGANKVAKYWKNGVLTNLTDGTFDAIATGITVYNGDVYVSGFEGSASSLQQARYWKNGVAVNLAANPSEQSVANSIAVSGSDVFVAANVFSGGIPQATLIRNGVRTTLYSGPGYSNAYKVFLTGPDVYVCGNRTSSNIALYWKNGVETILPAAAPLTEMAAFSLYVSGTDIYACGFEKTPAAQGNIEVARYWKNGQFSNLTTGVYHASANDIFVYGQDVYAGGYENEASGNGVAKYWRNGQAVTLTSGLFDASVFAIVVK